MPVVVYQHPIEYHCCCGFPDIDYVFDIINDIETVESKNSIKFSPILHEARCAERMKAWEKLIYWALDGKDVC